MCERREKGWDGLVNFRTATLLAHLRTKSVGFAILGLVMSWHR